MTWRSIKDDPPPLNPYGERWGPLIQVWCVGDNTPWPAYYDPWYEWKDRDLGPAWVIPDSEPPIAPEDASHWRPIDPPA